MMKMNRLLSCATIAAAALALLSPMLTLSALAAGGSVSGVSLRDLVLALTVIAGAGLALMVVIAYRRFRRHKQ